MPKSSKKIVKYKRRRRYRKKSMIRWRSMTTPMPTRFFTKLRYQENITVEPGAGGTCDAYVFSANGIYDPNISGVGHQPRGFDELMPLFDHFVVLGSKITVSFLADTDALYGQKVGVALRDNSTEETDINNYLEQGYVRSKLLSRNGGYPTVLSMFSSTRRFLGRSKPLSDSQLKGSASANPTEQCYFHVFAGPINSVNAETVLADVRIEYFVAFIEPADITQS